jgi:hypothetical protein
MDDCVVTHYPMIEATKRSTPQVDWIGVEVRDGEWRVVRGGSNGASDLIDPLVELAREMRARIEAHRHGGQ